jgi:hypothetical protein
VRLADVERFQVPRAIIAETNGHLRAAGARGLEVFVLWSGQFRSSEFLVRNAHVPRQASYQLEEGLLVRVEGEALHHLNVWLYEHRETLAVQLHAHPSDAFHSETDDAYPIVATQGGISIVAAYFCRDGLLSETTAAYRLGARGWDELDPPLDLIEVV